MSKIAVIGPSGMLGRQICSELGEEAYPVYPRMINLMNPNVLRQTLEGCDSVINCVGVIPVRNTSVLDMIRINSEFPYVLCEATRDLGQYTVLISTDCVFSGRSSFRYRVDNIPDPRDAYGRSKALGEVMAPHVCVVRTSFIGCEHGLMNWVMSAGLIAKSTGIRQTVDGYKNVLWTGSTVGAVAHSLIELVKGPVGERVTGIQHLATEQTISKHDLLLKLVEQNNLNVEVNPVLSPVSNRALQHTIALPHIDTALRDFPCRQLELSVA